MGEVISLSASRNLALLGAQWGDEGKGKIIDLLSPYFSIVARYQGGHNAGHTVWVDGEKFTLSLIPSGILHPQVICVIGNGLVVDLKALLKEIDSLESRGIGVEGRIRLSDHAHLILQYHKDLDLLSEAKRGEKKIGTTMRGIGPAYQDKVARRGVRVGDLLDMDRLAESVRANVSARNDLVTDSTLKAEDVIAELEALRPRIIPMITDTSLMLHQATAKGKSVLFEGAQGTLLDIDHGTYPYVTSSNPTIGGVMTGLGISHRSIDAVLGVVKAYSTRVGEGPFPTEISGKLGDQLRRDGAEYGAVTGRPRRCGWYDAVAINYSARINGLNALAITKLDVLDGMDELKICTGYKLPNGNITTDMPSTALLEHCEPMYEVMPGWSKSTVGITRFCNLPREAQNYVERLGVVSGVPAKIVTNGVERNSFIVRDDVSVPGLQWLDSLRQAV